MRWAGSAWPARPAILPRWAEFPAHFYSVWLYQQAIPANGWMNFWEACVGLSDFSVASWPAETPPETKKFLSTSAWWVEWGRAAPSCAPGRGPATSFMSVEPWAKRNLVCNNCAAGPVLDGCPHLP